MLKNKALNTCLQIHALLDEQQSTRFIALVECGVFPIGAGDPLLSKLATAFFSGDSAGETPEKIHSALFPGLAFSEARINLLCRKLLKALRQFLAFSEFMEDSLLQKRLLARALSRHGDYALFRRAARRLEKAARAQPFLDAGHYRSLADAYQAVYAHPDTPRIQPELAGSEAFEENLDLSYALAKLALIAEQRNRSKILKVDWNPSSFEEIRPLANRLRKTACNPLIGLYLDLIGLHAPEPNPMLFERVKCSFYLNWHLCNEPERFSIFVQLVNYTNSAHRQGIAGALSDQLWLYKAAAQHGWLLANGRISDTTFQNAVVVAVHLKDFEFAHWFIGRYEPFLPESEKEFAVHFATAHCCFYQGKFSEALENLRSIHTANPLKDLMKTGFQIRCLFELSLQEGAYTAVFSKKLNNFYRQLGRNRIVASSHRIGYRNMVRILRQINRKRLNIHRVTGKEKARLRDKIVSLTPLKSKGWLLEKADGL